MSQDSLRIGEVAQQAGVNVQTLRYYERRGLLEEPDREPSGFRKYPSEAVQLIRFIKRAQELGFTLNDVEGLIVLRENHSRNRSRVRELAAARVRDIEEKIRQLRAMRKALGALVQACDCDAQRLECPIIEALDDPSTQKRRSGSRGR